VQLSKELYDFVVRVVDERVGGFRRVEEALQRLAEAQVKTEERLNRLEDTVQRLAEAQARTEERLNRLEDTVQRLAEAQARTEERLNRLEDTVQRLAEAQVRTEERLNRLEDTVQRLAEAQRRTEEELRKLATSHRRLRQEVGGISRSIAYALENEAFRRLPDFLKTLGITVTERMVRAEVAGEEINIFARARRDGEEVLIVGEAVLRFDDAAKLRQLKRKAAIVEAEMGQRVLPLVVTHFARGRVLERAQKAGVLVVQSFQW